MPNKTTQHNEGSDKIDRQAWRATDLAVRLLEEAWHAEPAPDLELFLADIEPAHREHVLVELVKVDQEYHWKLDQPTPLETYLERWPELRAHDSILVELIQSECLTRALFSELPSAEDLLQRFGALARQIDLEVIAAQAAEEYRPTGPAAGSSFEGSAGQAFYSSPSAAPLFLPLVYGQRFGRYEIRSPLGDGGGGNVYLAYDHHLRREVAMKFPRHTDPKILKRFLREPCAAAAVEHRHICRIYDTGQLGGVHYIAMERIRGQTLQQRIECNKSFDTPTDRKEGNPLDPHEAADIARKIAMALTEVHQAGIIHRDIKSSNIMLDDRGEPVLMDFGLAQPLKASTGLTTTGSLVGTLAYMSPEQARGESADPRSDIYSLGVVLFQMLTGAVPYGLSPAEFFAQIDRRAQPPRPTSLRPDLEADLDGICRKAMACRRPDRYQSVSDMADALARYLEGRPQRIKAPRIRRQHLRWSVPLVILLLVVGGYLLRNIIRPEEPVPEETVRWIETNYAINGVQLARDGKRLFVAHAGDRDGCQVRELDFRTGGDLAEPITFPVRHSHGDLRLSADQRYLFTTNYYFEYISRIDLEGDRQPVPLRLIAENNIVDDGWRWATQVTITPDGNKLLVPMGRDGRPNGPANDQLAIFDISEDEHRLVAEIPLGGEPIARAVALTADSRRAYLATAPRPLTDDPQVFEVELQPPYKVRSLALPGATLSGVSISDRLSKLFVSDAARREVVVVDLETFSQKPPVATFSLQGRAPTVLLADDERGALFVVCMDNRSLFVLDATDGQILAEIDGLREGCNDLVLTPDKQSLLLPSRGQAGGVGVVRIPRIEPRITFSSDMAGNTYQIYTMQTDGSEIEPLFKEPSYAHDVMPRWSPDGTRIAFLSNRLRKPHVFVADRDGQNVTAMRNTEPVAEHVGMGVRAIDWSPDGKQIIYIHRERLAIHRVDVASGKVESLKAEFPEPYEQVWSVRWASDGKIIACAQRLWWAHDSDLFRIDPRTGTVQQITNEFSKIEASYSPAVSRDGQIVCHRKLVRDDPHPYLYLVHEQKVGQPRFERITQQPLQMAEGWPRWFPDSKKLVYTDQAPNSRWRHVFVLDLAKHTSRQLTQGSWNAMYPDVSVPLADPSF